MTDTSVIFNILARDNASTVFARAGRNVAGIAAGFLTGNLALGALTKAWQFGKQAMFGFNSELENSDIAFTTMLGSAQRSKAFLADLQSFAKSTPFGFPGLVQNAQQMMGMGIAAKDVIPDLTALGDSVASIGGSSQQVDQVTLAFDQMWAKGKLDMGNMNQLMQGGVPSALKILADAYHTTTGDMIAMISTGQVQSSEAMPLLVKGLEKGTASVRGLGGMMAKQSQTFSGALSNISDGLTQALAGAFRPFFSVVSSGAQAMGNWMSSPTFQKFGDRIAGGLSTAIGWGRKFVTSFNWAPIGHAVSVVWHVIKDDLAPAVGSIVKTFGPLVVSVGKNLMGAIGGLAGVLKPLGGFVKSSFGFIADHKTLFQAVAVGIGAIVVAQTAWNIAVGAWTAITRIATAVQVAWDAAMAANPIGIIIAALIGLSLAIGYLWTHSAAFRKFFINLWDDIWGFIKGVGHWFAHDFVGFFTHAYASITGGITHAKNWIVGKWNDVVAMVKSVPGRLAAIGSSMWDWLVTGFKGAVNSIIGGLNHVIHAINKVTHGLSDIWSWAGIPAIPAIPDIPRLARGGTATRAGMALVGERGPELLRMPVGASVIPLSGGSGAAGVGGPVTVCVHLDGSIQGLMTRIAAEVRGPYGGNVQVALGGHG